MTHFRKIALLTLAAPLALGLAGCGKSPTADGQVAEGKTIAPISAPAGKKWTDIVNVSDLDGYVLGNPDAPVKLVEYASLTCPHCAEFSSEAATALRDKYVASGVVSYEIRNQIHDPFDLVMARLVRCGPKESFQPLAEQIWGDLRPLIERAQSDTAGLQSAMKLPPNQRFVAFGDKAGLVDFFAARGLSREKANACLADGASLEAIADRSQKQSDELKVEGTPTFFINGANIGTQTWATLEPMLQRAGAR